MNFHLITPTDSEFQKLMMQKHLLQKKQRTNNHSRSSQIQPYPKVHKINTVESLPLTGQTLLSNSWLNNNSPTMNYKREKQLNQQNQKMKKLLKHQLQDSLIKQQMKRKQQNEQHKKIKKAMSTQNGVLDYLQKQIDKRNSFIKQCLQKQQKRKNIFIDQNMRKHNNALHLIQQNYDVDVFNHESDRYQQKQKINFQNIIQTNYMQAYQTKMMKQNQKSQYRRYLDQQYVRQKHNPITNPIQYHIQNPYFKKQLCKYL